MRAKKRKPKTLEQRCAAIARTIGREMAEAFTGHSYAAQCRRIRELEGALDLAGKHAAQWVSERAELSRKAVGPGWDAYHQMRAELAERDIRIAKLEGQVRNPQGQGMGRP
jgi:hypothetical protein